MNRTYRLFVFFLLGTISLFGKEPVEPEFSEKDRSYCEDIIVQCDKLLRNLTTDISILSISEQKKLYGMLQWNLEQLDKRTRKNNGARVHFLAKQATVVLSGVTITGENTWNRSLVQSCYQVVMETLLSTQKKPDILWGERMYLMRDIQQYAKRLPSINRSWHSDRKQNVTLFLEHMNQKIRFLSDQKKLEILKDIEEWDDYYHSERFPQFEIPQEVFQFWNTYPLALSPEYVKYPVQKKEYQVMYDRYRNSMYLQRQIVHIEKQYQIRWKSYLRDYVTDLYTNPPFATEELRGLMKKYSLEESLQKEILDAVTAAENAEKQKPQQKKAKNTKKK